MTEGMEIRDHFAAAALQAVVARLVVVKPGRRVEMDVDWDDLAIFVFCLADVMMENRD